MSYCWCLFIVIFIQIIQCGIMKTTGLFKVSISSSNTFSQESSRRWQFVNTSKIQNKLQQESVEVLCLLGSIIYDFVNVTLVPAVMTYLRSSDIEETPLYSWHFNFFQWNCGSFSFEVTVTTSESQQKQDNLLPALVNFVEQHICTFY